MPFALTLRFRIISLVALFTLILISAFTALLITRQLHVITENNLYRARIGTFSAKSAFERTLLSTIRAGSSPQAFQGLIPILQEGKLAEEVLVVDLKGKVVAGSLSDRVGTRLPPQEMLWVEYALNTYNPRSWFYAQVEPGQVTFYVPITLDDVPRYLSILRYSLGNMAEAIRQVGKLCALVALVVIAVVVPLCLLLIRSILGPIRALNEATQEIATGNLTQRILVPTEDELGELAETFNEMTSTLVAMKARAENANPLTKLPGNNVIHEEIERRIEGKKKFVAIYADLDNFKAFNDKYGIGAGDKAIKLTAQILKEAVQRKGSVGDFLGHEGGDDFILLTTPEKAPGVADYIGTEFDRRIRDLYSPEDRGKGFIVSKDREDNVRRFPIMTISLVGITNAHRELTSYAEVTNICAEVKEKAKLASKNSGKSSFVLDQRTADHGAQARDPHAPGALAATTPAPKAPDRPPGPAPSPPESR